MAQYKQNFELKNAAKDRLDGRYRGAILIFLLSSLITNTATMLVDNIGTATLNSIAYTSGVGAAYYIVMIVFNALLIVTNILCAVMNAGITLYFLKLACGQPLSVRDLFYGYKTDSKKALVIAAAVILCQTVCLGPSQYLLQQLLLSRDASWLTYLVPALLVGLCVYLPVSLGLSLAFYVMLDFPQKSPKETLSLCWRLMKGQRMRLFLLELGFLPLMLLCLLSFGIGFLWLNPYMQMTCTFFYLDLMKPDRS